MQQYSPPLPPFQWTPVRFACLIYAAVCYVGLCYLAVATHVLGYLIQKTKLLFGLGIQDLHLKEKKIPVSSYHSLKVELTSTHHGKERDFKDAYNKQSKFYWKVVLVIKVNEIRDISKVYNYRPKRKYNRGK